MSTTAPASDKKADKKTEPEKAPEQTDDQLLDAWVADVRKRIRDYPGTTPNNQHVHGKVDLHERLAAIQWEMGKLKPEAVHFQGYKYHSIQSIENNINRLSAIYRVRITPSRLESVVLEGGVRLRLAFTAFCWETDQTTIWEWEDDGEDLTKAGSYTQKYGLMKFFHVGDGQDPDAEAARGKPQRGRAASTTEARTAVPSNGAAADPDVKADLYKLAASLPANAGWPFKDDGSNIKIDAMLKSKMDPSNIRKLLVEAHVKAHGADCDHVKEAIREATAPESTSAADQPAPAGQGGTE